MNRSLSALTRAGALAAALSVALARPAPPIPISYFPSPYQTGSDLYFLLSVWNQYNVLLMRTPL